MGHLTGSLGRLMLRRRKRGCFRRERAADRLEPVLNFGGKPARRFGVVLGGSPFEVAAQGRNAVGAEICARRFEAVRLPSHAFAIAFLGGGHQIGQRDRRVFEIGFDDARQQIWTLSA